MNSKALITILIVILVGVAGYYVLTMPDQRSGTEKVGDAIGSLDQGVDNAARELEDRTPAERIGDSVRDATD